MVSLSSELLLPPIVSFREGTEARIAMGAMNLRLEYPGIFPAPVLIRLSADVTAPVSLMGMT